MQWSGGGENGLAGIAGRDLEQECAGRRERCCKRMGKMRQRAVAGVCTFQFWENEWFGVLKELIPELGNTGH